MDRLRCIGNMWSIILTRHISISENHPFPIPAPNRVWAGSVRIHRTYHCRCLPENIPIGVSAAKMECWCVSKMKYSLLMMMMIIGSVMVSGIEGGCIQEERNALLQIKTSLIDLYGLNVDHFLPSWVDDGRECCDWERVMCNTTTGHVTDLSLRNIVPAPYDDYKSIWPLNVSVFLHFKELTSLNLSRNCLDDGFIEQLELFNFKVTLFLTSTNNVITLFLFAGLGRLSSLKKLEILDLSNNRITNKTLPSLGALTSLRILNLNDNNLEGYFPALGMCLVLPPTFSINIYLQ
ncbi:hypothetical protein OSB04_006212 [Centaurea solstitialis]|uniref:Leucine-rich repeat-containing N-terminal plant-type domain-containing protein n=1 Tax=Centaurea solstitialis TaxID=347529 RepID=A0AA38WH83_9ASTR|nr:hypothetical protein OSB04_006212 [Centaurea solstitialis]